MGFYSTIKLYITKLFFSFLLTGLTIPVSAQPMGFDDSYMGMGDFSSNWREAYVNYALTPRDAIGASATYMRSDDKNKMRNLQEIVYTRLLSRWNMPQAQANIWVTAGIGAIQGTDKRVGDDARFSEVMLSPGVQFDYETKRIYFAANHRLYRSQHANHDFTSLRAGFSFFETDYTQTQPWFVIEARNMNSLSDKVEITPMLRLINKNFFIEAGVNNSREPRFNFMYIF
jgi:hypothetical protein